ncbi:chemotaxis protein CheC [Gammaproteobacteria bacterium]
MFELSEMQHDALVEVFNIGVGRAAASMSSMVNEEISLSVPSINFLNLQDAATILEGQGRENKKVCGVTQHFEGAFNTDVVLMFPEDKSLELVRIMVGESIPLEQLTEMEQEAMSEIGNILLNSCMGTMADILGTEMNGSLPVYQVGSTEEILGVSDKGNESFVLILRIDFILEKLKINGHVAFVMDADAMKDTCRHIDQYLFAFTG